MIRIKNITRINPLVRKGRYDIFYPNGRRGRLLINREITINYATYVLNRRRILLPGEPFTRISVFRVISGLDEIMKNEQQNPVNPEPETENVITPTNPETIVNEFEEETDKSSGEASSPQPDNIDPIETETKEDDPLDSEESEEVPVEPEVSIPTPTDAEPESTKEPVSTGKYAEEQLGEMTHKQLNELLELEGIELPRNANKQHKIDALMKLNG